MLYKFAEIMPILASRNLDDLENQMTFLKILAFVAFIGIPLIKLLFGKKDE